MRIIIQGSPGEGKTVVAELLQRMFESIDVTVVRTNEDRDSEKFEPLKADTMHNLARTALSGVKVIIDEQTTNSRSLKGPKAPSWQS
jgi:broad-specificity NMP kinase